ncbi:hypothetical protein KFE26_20495 [Shewanella sp. M16]|uniref:hypothetical protein n=1 Tax=Shewanella TaxID=22 RepID=UPI001BB0981D|nr:hypothetical protein [Shewanella sp. M16]MBS0044652.1 hypothetical protein [Shewanella sp. M16]
MEVFDTFQQAWQAERNTWRRYKPCFDLPMPNIALAKSLDRLLSRHNWSQNRYIRKLRACGATIKRWKTADGSWKTRTIPPRKASIRAEREETLDALARAMIYRADYDPDAPYLFEVKASIECLAEMIGQLHTYEPGYDGDNGQYKHGRKSCDPVHGALDDLEAADMILVVREFDRESGTYKSSRIFFKPKFFIGLGLTLDETRKMISRARKWQVKNGLAKSLKEKRQSEVLRQAESDRIATLKLPSVRNLLARIKREFTGDNKHTKRVMDAEQRLKEAERKIVQQRKTPKMSDVELRLRQLKTALPPIYVYEATKIIREKHGVTFGEQFDLLLLEILETRT